jgi:sporulation protein YqfC
LKLKPNRLRTKLAEFLELPLDTVVELPKIVVSGNQQLVIENYRGVIEYEPSVIRIGTKLGELKISGAELGLISVLKEELVIAGKIGRIEMVDWR